MLRKVKIMTDSACDLSRDMLNKFNIGYLGLICDINDKHIVEDCGESLSYKEFYNMLKGDNFPVTGQINPSRFYDEFKSYLDKGFDILYISFSSALSGTHNSAIIAKEELLLEYPDARIEVVDSRAVSSAQGMLVYECSKYLESGKSLEECVGYVEELKKRLRQFFTVKDLKHLEKGGRITGISATIGSILNVRPLLKVNGDGTLSNVSKVRGDKKVLKELFNKLRDNTKDRGCSSVFISHADNIDDANELRDMIISEYGDIEIVIQCIGLAIGSHVGQGAVGIFFLGD